eukprot:c24891_g1_i4 orf=219-1481(+)
MACYWASCASGLQPQLVSELEKLENVYLVSDTLFLGGVLFSTSSAPVEVLKLRSADNIYAFLGHFQGILHEKDGALLYIKGLPEKIDWGPPLNLFSQWQAFIKEDSIFLDNKNNDLMSFRVSCDRSCLKMKKHEFTSMEAAAALGEGVQKLFGWPADMRCYDLEVVIWIQDSETLLALSLVHCGKQRKKEISISSSLARQRPRHADSQLYSWRQYRKVLVETSLKPSTAYGLLQLGQVLPGDLVVDPMCGCGTIPLEAADWFGGKAMCLAGDLASKAIDATHKNAEEGGAVGLCDILRWDAAILPLRSGCVDRIVCDMPFGVRCGSSRTREWLCPSVVKEVVRVLRPGTGIAVLMAQSKSMKHEVAICQKAFLELLQHFPIEMAGLRAEVFVIKRTMEPVSQVYDHKRVFQARVNGGCRK